MTEPNARERIIAAAERLIAERGAGVPLRDIAIEAGQRNNSAVHYYFGSRDGLIRAIVDHRQGPMESRRMVLLAECERAGRADDVPSLVDILIRPMFDTPYADGSTHYARFLERVRDHPAISRAHLSAGHWPAVEIVTARLQRALADLPPATRVHRLSAMATIMFGLLADAERRAADAGTKPRAPSVRAADDIVDMLVGLLTAIPSAGRDS